MANLPPLVCRWTGDSFAPVGRSAKEADERFVIGALYRLAEWLDRSQASHSHEFAFVAEAWRQLPEGLSDQFPSPEHLRKRCLIDAGYFNQMSVDAGTNAAAIRVAAGFKAQDEYCVAVVQGPLVLVRTAKSQSRRAMDRKEFSESKQAVLEIISNLIGVAPETLTRETGKAA